MLSSYVGLRTHDSVDIRGKKPIATMLPGVKLWGFKPTKRKKSSLFDPTGKTGKWILAIHVDVWWQDSGAKKSAMS